MLATHSGDADLRLPPRFRQLAHGSLFSVRLLREPPLRLQDGRGCVDRASLASPTLDSARGLVPVPRRSGGPCSGPAARGGTLHGAFAGDPLSGDREHDGASGRWRAPAKAGPLRACCANLWPIAARLQQVSARAQPLIHHCSPHQCPHGRLHTAQPHSWPTGRRPIRQREPQATTLVSSHQRSITRGMIDTHLPRRTPNAPPSSSTCKRSAALIIRCGCAWRTTSAASLRASSIPRSTLLSYSP